MILYTFDLVLGVVHQALADQRVHAGHVRGRVLVRVEPAGAREHHAPAELVAARQRHQVSVDPDKHGEYSVFGNRRIQYNKGRRVQNFRK